MTKKNILFCQGGNIMNFEQNFSLLFDDINIPEIFISEYLTAANGDYVKLYMYCFYLCKHKIDISPLDLSQKLSLPISTIEQGLKYWEENEVLIKKGKSYIVADLKQLEVNKLYKPKLALSTEDAIKNTEKNVYRSQAITAVNEMFFQGLMSEAWFSDINLLFSKYMFDEDVVISLFNYCYTRQALHRKYLFTVADAWSKSGVKTQNDLDRYSINYEKATQIKKSIAKKLGLVRKLSEYEEAYVEKWFFEFNYPMDVIEIALRKTTSKTNPNFDYLDKILTDWHERNLNTTDEINTFMKEQKEKAKSIKNLTSNPQSVMQAYKDVSTNQYEDLSKFYIN